MKPYFITSPIFYVNAAPHIGHAYTMILADAFSRFQRLIRPTHKCALVTGTDEHGLKIQKAADKSKKDVQTYCNGISGHYSNLADTLSVSYDCFIRTTEQRHKETVAHFWNSLKADSHLYKGSYAGWYSVEDETFVAEKDIAEVRDKHGHVKKVYAESGHLVEWATEENYMFKLSHFQDDLLHWLRESEEAVKPRKFHKIVESWIEAGLHDLSVSRHNSRVPWGIPVPDDPEHTIYVWLDALVNYLTAAGYPETESKWPPDIQVVGKDILKFHAIYWPAFLMAAGLDLPRTIFCHSHWTVDDEKMSKSKGNIVDPFVMIDKYSADGLRYFLLREGVPHSDGNFNIEKMRRILNAELADNLGNLLSRCTAPLVNRDQVFPAFDYDITKRFRHCNPVLEKLRDLPERVREHYSEGNIYLGIDAIMAVLRETNAFVQSAKPWELAKAIDGVSSTSPHQRTDAEKHLNAVLHTALESVRISAILLQPVIPVISGKILDKLQVDEEERIWSYAELPSLEEKLLSATESSHVFMRLPSRS